MMTAYDEQLRGRAGSWITFWQLKKKLSKLLMKTSRSPSQTTLDGTNYWTNIFVSSKTVTLALAIKYNIGK